MTKQFMKIVAFFLLVLSVAGCTTNLSSISEDPQRFAGKTVSVKGVVNSVITVPFTDYSIFIMQDEVVKAAVFTDGKHSKDAEIQIKAEVVSFPEGEFNQKGDEVTAQIETFLVNNNFANEEKAERIAASVLKAVNGLGSKLGQYFFLLEITEE